MVDKEVAKELFRNIPFALVLGGVFLFVVGAAGGFPLISIEVVESEWRLASAVLGGMLAVSGFFFWRKERNAVHESVTKGDTGRLVEHELYLHRKDIHWKSFNEKVSYRYWACGTSLVGVVERGLIQKYLGAGIRDIKVILPHTDNSYSSYEQLEQFNKFPDRDLVADQVELAKVSFDRLRAHIQSYEKQTESYLRKYGGTMYSNITIFDDDAFISFYDCTGVGDSNFALHFNKSTNEQGYHLVEEEFLRMWNAESGFGMKVRRKKGTSIIFLNDSNQVLLFLRDDKKGILFPNCWDVLGGQVEEGETPVECIIREMHEEISVRLRDPNLFNVYDMDDRIEYTFWQRADFDIAEMVLHEGQHLEWFTEEEISRMPDAKLAFGFKSVLLDFFHQKPFE